VKTGQQELARAEISSMFTCQRLISWERQRGRAQSPDACGLDHTPDLALAWRDGGGRMITLSFEEKLPVHMRSNVPDSSGFC
jgi:hypothetical protein